MPNALNHEDGEDMLASIRALVSDRTRPDAPPQPAAPLPPLLLGPALRVDTPETGLDPAALRAMVAETVRDELRGQTGTRFTRQLRRLIRAEIAEALAAEARRR